MELNRIKWSADLIVVGGGTAARMRESRKKDAPLEAATIHALLGKGHDFVTFKHDQFFLPE